MEDFELPSTMTQGQTNPVNNAITHLAWERGVQSFLGFATLITQPSRLARSWLLFISHAGSFHEGKPTTALGNDAAIQYSVGNPADDGLVRPRDASNEMTGYYLTLQSHCLSCPPDISA